MKKGTRVSVDDVVASMKAQFGDAAKAFWVYDCDLCPCCMANPIGKMEYEGKDAVSLNVFMYRERAALIAYPLCGKCALPAMEEANSGSRSLHDSIERNLISAYLRYLSSRGS